MEILKIVGLCLSCFSLGVSLTGLLFTTISAYQGKQTVKRSREKNAESNRKLIEKEREREAKKKLPPFRNPHEPMQKLPGESSEHFVHRITEALELGELTMNAARKSLGLPPIEKEEERNA